MNLAELAKPNEKLTLDFDARLPQTGELIRR